MNYTNSKDIFNNNPDSLADSAKYSNKQGNLINDSILSYVKIFEIPAREFFFDEAFEVISSNKQHESSLYVPLKFAFKDSKFYIPNLDKGQIWVYSEKGKRLSIQAIPSQIQSFDYFEFLEDGTMVGSSFADGKIYEINADNEVIKEVESQDVKFSTFKNNYIYRKSNQFIDRKNLFKSTFSFDYLYDSYDYYLLDSTLFIISFEDRDINITINNTEGKTRKNLLKDFDLKKFSKPYILNYTGDQLTFLLDPVFGRKADLQVVYYNISKSSYEIKYLRSPLDNTPLIGEGAALWGAGMIFIYENDKLYLMYTDKEAIKVFAYKI